MRHFNPFRSRPPAALRACLVALVAVLLVDGASFAGDPVALRVESFTVAPSSQPLARVVVKNLLDASCDAVVRLEGPDGWQITPASRPLTLAAGETATVAFDVKRGVTLEANRYAMTASATAAGATVTRRQEVACTSAPYFKPTIDGDPADWKDAIPVTLTTAGRKTEIRTFWNSRQLSLLVAVDEERLCPFAEDASAPPDAVQIAIAPQGSVTAASADGQAERYEFLAVATSESGGGRCFRLASPGVPLAETQKRRSLLPLAYDDAKVAVRRAGETTYYEIGLPTRPIRDRIRPGEGREFCLSVVVHDPDGTGTRDWGEAAGLWPEERNRLAWSRWQGDRWGPEPPFDNKTPWGMCSSKY